MEGLIVAVLVFTWLIKKAVEEARTDQELARQGIVSPRLQAKYGDQARAKTERYGFADFLADAWSDGWRQRTEKRREAKQAARDVQPDAPGGWVPLRKRAKAVWRKLVDPVPDRTDDPKPTDRGQPDTAERCHCPECGAQLTETPQGWWHANGPNCPAANQAQRRPSPRPRTETGGPSHRPADAEPDRPNETVHRCDGTYCTGCNECRDRQNAWRCNRCGDSSTNRFPTEAEARADYANHRCGDRPEGSDMRSADEAQRARLNLGIGEPADLEAHRRDHYRQMDSDQLLRDIAEAIEAGDWDHAEFLDGLLNKVREARNETTDTNKGDQPVTAPTEDVQTNEAARRAFQQIGAAADKLAEAAAMAEAARAQMAAAAQGAADGMAGTKFDTGATSAAHEAVDAVGNDTLSDWSEKAEAAKAAAESGLASLEKYRDAEDVVASNNVDARTLEPSQS